MGFLRIIFRLARFWRADARRGEIQRDLKSTYATDRAKADYSSQDYRLKRDLAAVEDEGKNK
jgi:hypothetical protein